MKNIFEKVKDIIITLCVFYSVITIPFIYIGFYHEVRSADDPNLHIYATIFLVISHIVTGKLIYDVYIDKYSPKYHDKKKGERIIPPLKMKNNKNLKRLRYKL